jgi:hypothetical protein
MKGASYMVLKWSNFINVTSLSVYVLKYESKGKSGLKGDVWKCDTFPMVYYMPGFDPWLLRTILHNFRASFRGQFSDNGSRFKTSYL